MTDPEVVRLRARVVALRQNRLLVHHATNFAITTAIVSLLADGLYTWWYWLVRGRDERRTKPYAEVRYFGIILQLAVETAAIVHLLQARRRTQ